MFTIFTAIAALGHSLNPVVTGDYIEARSCNVYTGACHMNGELVMGGREAIIAWKIKTGSYSGVSIDGLSVVAVISAENNLSKSDSSRTSVLYLDQSATPQQCAALAKLVHEQYGKVVGNASETRVASIEISRNGDRSKVHIAGAVYLKTMSICCSHCVMPHLLWFEPMIALSNRQVANAAVNEFKGSATIRTTWQRLDETSSFIGEFKIIQ